ncbi:hypothetical protein ACF9IK_04785 [Kitasatospora hibisci]|uniref:hypothetical protein n=1 Tax=Kitasatospora hibisci TaxID=3369522 RepID=UPI0037553976
MLQGVGWGAFPTVTDFKTAKAPALAAHQGKLCLAATGVEERVDDGGWATTSMQLGGTIHSAPALVDAMPPV